jgi:hypothetical protein
VKENVLIAENDIKMTKDEIRKKIESILSSMGFDKEQSSWWLDSTVLSLYNKTPQELIDTGRGEELLARLIALAQGNVGF